ncbi:hypothetical protein AAF712_003953 [Marasmius tenuissimus]|uniref:Uncharacterized protein n=1 Tax=Marasmius tenuissimus TaxID=585030 RepID=A0ABR3A626_9AGAR
MRTDFASGASMLPPTPAFNQHHSVAFTCSPVSSIAFHCFITLSLPKSATTYLSEAYGLAVTLLSNLLFHNNNPPRPNTLFTDHLNSTRIINDSITTPPPPHSFSSLPAAPSIDGFSTLLAGPDTHLESPTRHLTNQSGTPSLLNPFADFLASQSQNSALNCMIPVALLNTHTPPLRHHTPPSSIHMAAPLN